MENIDLYKKILYEKYTFSEKEYKKIFDKENHSIFLTYLDQLNVYPLYPEPINMKVPPIEKIDLYNGEDYSELEKKINELDKISVFVAKKNREIREMGYRDVKPFRKFFSAEIGDYITEKLGGENTTIAWLKMYELLDYFKLLTPKDNVVKYFGICEHPGAFIYAINHYVKTNFNADYDFVFQSLKPNSADIFKTEMNLLKEYRDKIDYGINNGDVTNIDNIKYYREKYKDDYFQLLTADCGLDVSEDVEKQETMLMKVDWGAFLVNIGLSKKGSNFVQKMFTYNHIKMKELIVIASYYYDEVYLVKPLTTKLVSGEIYMVCKGFKSINDEEFNQLLKYYENFESKKMYININKINFTFFENLDYFNTIVGIRRILNIHYMIFRNNNYEYYKDKEIIYTLTDLQTKHYVEHYIALYSVKVLKEEDKLISNSNVKRRKFMN